MRHAPSLLVVWSLVLMFPPRAEAAPPASELSSTQRLEFRWPAVLPCDAFDHASAQVRVSPALPAPVELAVVGTPWRVRLESNEFPERIAAPTPSGTQVTL